MPTKISTRYRLVYTTCDSIANFFGEISLTRDYCGTRPGVRPDGRKAPLLLGFLDIDLYTSSALTSPRGGELQEVVYAKMSLIGRP